jgi:hypothetical protein
MGKMGSRYAEIGLFSTRRGVLVTTKEGWPVHLEKWIPTGQLPYSYRKTHGQGY